MPHSAIAMDRQGVENVSTCSVSLVAPSTILNQKIYPCYFRVTVSNLVDKTEHETVHFYRVPQNRSVPIGATVELECIPRSNVQYVIWYFQPVSRSIRSGPRKIIIAAHQPEPLELAMCQPDILCK